MAGAEQGMLLSRSLVRVARQLLNRGREGGLRRRFMSFRDEVPSDPQQQAQYLRDLNRSGQHDTVIQLFEAERLANTEEVFGQYVRALARADKLNGTALMQTLYRGAQSYLGAGAGAAAAAALRPARCGPPPLRCRAGWVARWRLRQRPAARQHWVPPRTPST
jgi:hypothetical protein